MVWVGHCYCHLCPRCRFRLCLHPRSCCPLCHFPGHQQARRRIRRSPSHTGRTGACRGSALEHPADRSTWRGCVGCGGGVGGEGRYRHGNGGWAYFRPESEAKPRVRGPLNCFIPTRARRVSALYRSITQPHLPHMIKAVASPSTASVPHDYHHDLPLTCFRPTASPWPSACT